MRKLFALGFFLTLICTLSAQVSMRTQLSQSAYLQYEPVYVRVFFRNVSGHALAFGETKGLRGSLRFDVFHTGTRSVRIFPKDEKKMPSMVGVIMPPGGSYEAVYRLSDYYDMRQLGNYSVKAVLSHPQLSTAYESVAVVCKVTSGMKVWGPVTVGVPDSGKERSYDPDFPQKIQTRNYTIVSYYTGKVTAYALVIDDKQKTYLVKRIGFDLGANLKPQCEVDFLSRLNIMIAASPTVYAYYQYNVDGHLEKKQVYIKTSTTPVLVLDKETGVVLPAGGRIARKDQDYEEIKDLPFTEDMLGNRRSRRIMEAMNDLQKDAKPDDLRDQDSNLPDPDFGK